MTEFLTTGFPPWRFRPTPLLAEPGTSLKPSIVTSALVSSIDVTIDSAPLCELPAMPACAPLSVRHLPTVTFSANVPAPTVSVPQETTALTPAWTVARGSSLLPWLESEPPVETFATVRFDCV